MIKTEALKFNYNNQVSFNFPDISLNKNENLLIIGSSGIGKTTLLHLLAGLLQSNSGSINLYGQDISKLTQHQIDKFRGQNIGIVFQKPNPFPKSIRENITFGLKVNNMTDNLDDRVEKALTQAALWDEVKNDLDKNALDLSGGQQQRLCIARTIAVEPDTILMDEPCSALDPVATKKIEDLMQILVKDFSILIVTHNMQQASRVSNYCAFFTTKATDDGRRTGELVEYSDTKTMFTNPSESLTEEYISGRFG